MSCDDAEGCGKAAHLGRAGDGRGGLVRVENGAEAGSHALLLCVDAEPHPAALPQQPLKRRRGPRQQHK